MRNNAENLALPAWQAAIDPISKLLLILLFTLAAFAAGNLPSALIILAASFILALLTKNLPALWGMCAFSIFLILTMLLIQGLFWPGNHTAAFSVASLTFYQEGLDHAALLACRILTIIFSSSFFIQTTTISENARYLENSGLSYQQVYVLMSVCYILPQMQENLRKIQLAQKARGSHQPSPCSPGSKISFPSFCP